MKTEVFIRTFILATALIMFSCAPSPSGIITEKETVPSKTVHIDQRHPVLKHGAHFDVLVSEKHIFHLGEKLVQVSKTTFDEYNEGDYYPRK